MKIINTKINHFILSESNKIVNTFIYVHVYFSCLCILAQKIIVITANYYC